MSGIRRDGYYLRDPAAVVITTRDSLLLGRRSVPTSVPQRMSQLLQRLSAPVTGSSLLDDPDVAELTEPLSLLVEHGVVLEAEDEAGLLELRSRVFRDSPGYVFEPDVPRCEHLVFAMTGSVVSGLMAPFILSLAFSRFHNKLDLVFTEAALSFVQPELFEYYGIRTWTDAFVRRDQVTVPHITLAKSADLLLVMPASARALARLAAGECSDLLSLIAAATSAPVVVAPTMNTAMWDHPPVRRNVEQLRSDGCYIIEPTVFFEAAELIKAPEPAFGMFGVFWGGPASLMSALAGVVDRHRTLSGD